MTDFAVVPARGGSQRIPGKNIRDFFGVPIIERTISTLRKSRLFEAVIVSTDDPIIAEVALKAGAEVPFMRPKELADDFATTSQVANHSIGWLLNSGADSASFFLVAYPTAVMMTEKHLRESRALLEPRFCDFVFAGARFPSEIERSWRRNAKNFVEPVFHGNQAKRSQDLDPAFFDAGQFYWSTKDGWTPEVLNEGKRRRIYEIDPLEAVDINTEQDWARAERLFNLLRSS